MSDQLDADEVLRLAELRARTEKLLADVRLAGLKLQATIDRARKLRCSSPWDADQPPPLPRS
jgi:hypothetical protein